MPTQHVPSPVQSLLGPARLSHSLFQTVSEAMVILELLWIGKTCRYIDYLVSKLAVIEYSASSSENSCSPSESTKHRIPQTPIMGTVWPSELSVLSLIHDKLK